jgi:hypothetical protein
MGMFETTLTYDITKCAFCDGYHGGRCPHVKSIEYYKDGSVKRVEFLTPNDYAWPSSDQWSSTPRITWSSQKIPIVTVEDGFTFSAYSHTCTQGADNGTT